METLYVLLVLLVLTRAFGEIAVRLRQPMLVGELIAGVLLGVLVRHFSGTFPVLSGLTENEVFLAITDLGIFFLMLLGGLEMQPREVAEGKGGSVLVAVSAMTLPLAAGFGIAWAFLPESDFKVAQAVFVGVGLAVTAVPVAIRVLIDLDQLQSRLGRVVVAAAVIDDILSLILLAVLTALIRTGELPAAGSLVLLVGKVTLFFIVLVVVGRYVLPPVGRRLARIIRIDELEFSFLVAVALGFAVLAEALGMHFILGAFGAGLFFSQRTIGEEVHTDVRNKVSAITTGFLAPIFFASIGLHLEPSAAAAIPGFLALLILIAFASKFIGAALPARLYGFTNRQAAAIGVAMSARGAVELILADIALRAGLFTEPDPAPPAVEHLFSAIVMVAIVTTVAVPIALRPLVATSDHSRSKEPGPGPFPGGTVSGSTRPRA